MAPHKLHIVYRSTGPENRKARPAFYSKLLTLCSLLRSIESCGRPVDIVFLNDGPIPADRLRLMEQWGRVRDVADVPLGPLGNQLRYNTAGSEGLTRSYMAALRLVDVEGWGEDDAVYFVEDDYLHTRDAVARLIDAVESLSSVSYFSPFATIDWRDAVPLHTDRGTWFTGPSATSTFAARIRTLRTDRWIHLLSFFAGGTADRDICNAFQGRRPFPWPHVAGDLLGTGAGPSGRMGGRASRAMMQTALNALAIRRGFARHTLAGTYPYAAMHVETAVLDLLGSGEWELEADETLDWASARQIRVRGARDEDDVTGGTAPEPRQR